MALQILLQHLPRAKEFPIHQRKADKCPPRLLRLLSPTRLSHAKSLHGPWAMGNSHGAQRFSRINNVISSSVVFERVLG